MWNIARRTPRQFRSSINPRTIASDVGVVGGNIIREGASPSVLTVCVNVPRMIAARSRIGKVSISFRPAPMALHIRLNRAAYPRLS